MNLRSTAAFILAFALTPVLGESSAKEPRQPRDDPALLRRACPDYTSYAAVKQ